MKERDLGEILLGRGAPLMDWLVGSGKYANDESICTKIANLIVRCRSSNSGLFGGENIGDSSVNQSNKAEKEHKEEPGEENKEEPEAQQDQMQAQQQQDEHEEQQAQPEAHSNQQQVEQPDVGIPNNCAAEGSALCGGSWVILDDQHFG